MTTSEGKQKPVVQLDEVDKIVFDKPEVIVRKKKDPKVIIIEEKPADKPAVQPERNRWSRLSRPNRKQNLLLLLKQTDVRSRRQNPGYRSPQLQRPHCTGRIGTQQGNVWRSGFYLNNSLNRKCSLNGLNENAIADAYEALCNSDYKPLLADCAQIRKDLRLNDWGVLHW